MQRFWALLFGLWLGVGVGVSFLAIPPVFAASRTGEVTRVQSGRIAQSILARSFQAQYVLLGIAVSAHLLTARTRPLPDGFRLRTVLLACLAGVVLAGGLGLQPVLRGLHQRMYDPAAAEVAREEAGKRFRVLHGISQVGNLTGLALVFAGFWASGAMRPRRVPGPGPAPGTSDSA